MTDAELLATGPEFIKEGMRGTEPVIEEIIKEARKEIQIIAYLFTPRALHILDLLREAAERHVRITLVLNDLESQDPLVRSRLATLSAEYSGVTVVDFTYRTGNQIHAKVVVVDRKKAVVGSANFSWRGMYGNYEIGVLIRNKPAWMLGKLVDRISGITSKSYKTKKP